jgi:hypothetical protein
VPEAQDVEDAYKQLLKIYKKLSGKNEHEFKYDIRVTKFHNKHIKDNKEYENILGQKHFNRKSKKVINIYISTP